MLIKALAAAAGNFGGGYNIEDSLRFNDNDSAYLSRTPASAGNRKTWTWSGWVKRGNIGITATLFTSDKDVIRFQSDDTIAFFLNDGVTVMCLTNAVYRDTSGWYHIVATYDSTEATSSNRMKIYVNGIQQTFSSASYPSLNQDSQFNNTVSHTHGVNSVAAIIRLFDGYMAEVNFIDGQALTPDDFGQIDATTGEWSPIPYAGTYGTNGFYLPFNGNANDDSGNGNNWTENNLASTDYMIDTPTNNFSTLNPLTTTMTLSEGNLKETTNVTNNWQSAINTLGVSSGKWYFETCAPQALNSPPYAAIGITTNPNFGTKSGNNYLGNSADSWGYISDGNKYTSAIGTSYGTTYTNGDVIGCALDMDAGTITFYKNNVSQGVAYTGLTGTMFCGACSYAASGTTSNNINFGQDSSFAGLKTRQGNTDSNGKGDFYYTPPAGYLALCTDNLAEPAIVDSETQFNVVTYTGDGTANKVITGVGFQPDMVWIKSRSNAFSHNIYDSVRGVSKRLQPNLTNVESSPISGVKSFDADGFTLGNDTDDTNFTAGNTYVAWCWKAGGTAVTNTDGSITSQVSANVDAGFSIVSYTGNGTAGANVGHGLSSAPDMMIVKNRTSVDSWAVYHSSNTSAPETERLLLNSTAATADSVVYWNDTAPTSSVFTLGDNAIVNQSSDNYIAYCFHSVEGFSKFGSYTGNGSTNGPFVYTGFRPAFVMMKRTDSTSDWTLLDTSRSTYNVVSNRLWANLSTAESTAGLPLDIVSNGFKLRTSDAYANASGGSYIYMAFAESPTKFSLGR